MTLAIGLGIGRKVFRALNSVECLLAVIAIVGAFLAVRSDSGLPTAAGSVSSPRPAVYWFRSSRSAPLTRRSNEVLAGDGTTAEDRRSSAHLYYVGLEVAKVIALVIAAAALLLHG